MSSTPDVLISEVGPRDGLQSVSRVMSTAHKLRWLDALVAAGLREIEVGSFVPAKLLPQMADTAEITRRAVLLGQVCFTPALHRIYTGFTPDLRLIYA